MWPPAVAHRFNAAAQAQRLCGGRVGSLCALPHTVRLDVHEIPLEWFGSTPISTMRAILSAGRRPSAEATAPPGAEGRTAAAMASPRTGTSAASGPDTVTRTPGRPDSIRNRLPGATAHPAVGISAPTAVRSSTVPSTTGVVSGSRAARGDQPRRGLAGWHQTRAAHPARADRHRPRSTRPPAARRHPASGVQNPKRDPRPGDRPRAGARPWKGGARSTGSSTTTPTRGSPSPATPTPSPRRSPSWRFGAMSKTPANGSRTNGSTGPTGAPSAPDSR